MKDHHAAYITWEEFERNQRVIVRADRRPRPTDITSDNTETGFNSPTSGRQARSQNNPQAPSNPRPKMGGTRRKQSAQNGRLTHARSRGTQIDGKFGREAVRYIWENPS